MFDGAIEACNVIRGEDLWFSSTFLPVLADGADIESLRFWSRPNAIGVSLDTEWTVKLAKHISKIHQEKCDRLDGMRVISHATPSMKDAPRIPFEERNVTLTNLSPQAA